MPGMEVMDTGNGVQAGETRMGLGANTYAHIRGLTLSATHSHSVMGSRSHTQGGEIWFRPPPGQGSMPGFLSCVTLNKTMCFSRLTLPICEMGVMTQQSLDHSSWFQGIDEAIQKLAKQKNNF